MNQNSFPQSQGQAAAAAAEKKRTINQPLVISVWVAPIIVGVVVLVLSLAVAGVLLGGK